MSSVELEFENEHGEAIAEEVCARLKVNDLESLFRLEESQVVAHIELDKNYATLNRTFSVFAKILVDNEDSKWLLGFDHPSVYLQQVTVKEGSRGVKRGPREFTQLGRRLQAAGFTRVDTEGVRFPRRTTNPEATEFGYNVIPKWGFDGVIPESSRTDLGNAHSGLTSIQELLRAEKGTATWKEVGETCVLDFNLTPNSRSWRILADYLGQTLEQVQSD